jgi:hypothetical protein
MGNDNEVFMGQVFEQGGEGGLDVAVGGGFFGGSRGHFATHDQQGSHRVNECVEGHQFIPKNMLDAFVIWSQG